MSPKPVIFLTGRSDSADIVQGFELGAVDYVAKPFNTHELLARVNTHLVLILSNHSRKAGHFCQRDFAADLQRASEFAKLGKIAGGERLVDPYGWPCIDRGALPHQHIHPAA